MKMYRSLVYREWRLSRGHYILMTILFLLMESLFILPIIVDKQLFIEPTAENIEAIQVDIAAFALILAAVCGFFAGMNNRVHKADIASGWKRYSYALPPTAKQRAASDLIMKFMVMTFFAALLLCYVIVAKTVFSGKIIGSTMSMYLIVSSVTIVFDTVYCGILLMANSRNDLKKYGIIASAAGVALWLILTNFPVKIGSGKNISFADMLFKLVDTMNKGYFILISAAVFVLICALYYVVMWRSYERREA
ncbi:MAG: hypothetical protein IKN66_04495 [Ruminococcus sp.]|nr:hypothetical protein [Ruminococcus sp.]